MTRSLDHILRHAPLYARLRARVDMAAISPRNRLAPIVRR